jgi:hypothetical protein
VRAERLRVAEESASGVPTTSARCDAEAAPLGAGAQTPAAPTTDGLLAAIRRPRLDHRHAIGVYLTTIPAVSNSAANPTLEPACP